MYRAGSTDIPGMSRRTFRVSGLGEYRRAVITIPTQSYANEPSPGPVSGGLGDLSSLTSSPLFWLAAAAGGFWLWKKYGR